MGGLEQVLSSPREFQPARFGRRLRRQGTFIRQPIGRGRFRKIEGRLQPDLMPRARASIIGTVPASAALGACFRSG
jgi:hypothetical protein